MNVPPRQRMAPAKMALGLVTRPTALFRQQARDLGDTFEQRILGVAPSVVVTRPEDVKALFTAPPEDVPNGNQNTAVGPLVGPNSVLTLQGNEHLRHRKMLLPFFHGDRMRQWGPRVEDLMHDRIDRWEPGQVVRMQDDMQAVTFETILMIVFGVDDARRHDELRRIVTTFASRAGSGWRGLVDAVAASRGRQVGPMRRLSAALDEVIYAEIESHRRRTDLEDRSDVLSQLLLARDESGGAFSDAELRDELVTLLLVGHETTASALSWGAERLARTPDVVERASRELVSDDAGEAYINALVYETLRDRPVVPLIARTLQKPMTLGGYDLPAGTIVNINIYLVNHRADTYEDPFRFSPERFLTKRPGTYELVSFGGGIRRCLGGAFAEMEMRHVYRALCSRARLEPVDPRPERAVLRAVTVAPAQGGTVRITSVAGRPASGTDT